MPRSFLVKTHPGPRAPSYRLLETLRDSTESCISCRGLATPLFLLDRAAPAVPSEPPWAGITFTTCLSQHQWNENTHSPSGPVLLGVNQADPRAGRTPSPPLKGSQPPLPTRHCDKACSSLGALKVHIRTHTLPCRCSLCGKAFSRPWLLQGHIRTHTGEKPYSCPHCSRAFADRSNLRAHLQTHAGTRKYHCRGCTKTFSRLSLLGRHADLGCCRGPASAVEDMDPQGQHSQWLGLPCLQTATSGDADLHV